MTKHTPGPWDVTDTDIIYHTNDRLIIGPGPSFYELARVRGYVGPDNDGIANAALIAAAPDLLARLRLRVEQCGCCGDADFAVDVACEECIADRAAIAKAEGRG